MEGASSIWLVGEARPAVGSFPAGNCGRPCVLLVVSMANFFFGAKSRFNLSVSW